MRWRTVGTDTGLSNPTNDTQAESIGRIIPQWSDTTVTPANQGYTAYGCGCGAAATRKAKGACCEWGSLRIDAQRKFAIGKKDPVTFNAYNIQFGTGSYAAVNIQCNFTLRVADIRTAFQRSMAQRQRIWLGNQAGYDACVSGGRNVEADD
ncbi:MAG: hypothetical protein ACRD4P_17280 [Bryobacteraceae bacterium]